MRRSHVLLAGAVVVAGGAALLGAGHDTTAEIPGAPLELRSGEAKLELRSSEDQDGKARAKLELRSSEDQDGKARAKLEPAAISAPISAIVDKAKAAAAQAAPIAVELDRIARDGDRYIAPLAGGRQAVLTLEPTLQALAERLLNESRAPRGAIVAMTPDGRILALAGRRTEQPEGSTRGTFDGRLAVDAWAPAASIFKLVTAAALVDAGVGPDDKVCFHGGLRSVLEHNLRDDRRDSRCETLAYGVAHSQNAIVGKLAFQKLEPRGLEGAAHALGWTAAVPELAATLGDLEIPATRDLAFARSAAGFSATRLSVLGGALVAATFAAGGDQPAPRLIDSIDGVAVPVAPARRAISADTARAVARMMVLTCDKGSAARSFRGRAVRVAGKTGTLTREQPFYMEHSWFVGFAPADRPQVIVSVLFGNPESWHLRGHEAARRLIDRALRLASPREKGRAAAAPGQPNPPVDKRDRW